MLLCVRPQYHRVAYILCTDKCGDYFITFVIFVSVRLNISKTTFSRGLAVSGELDTEISLGGGIHLKTNKACCKKRSALSMYMCLRGLFRVIYIYGVAISTRILQFNIWPRNHKSCKVCI
jgi:hypothetical protein